MARIFGQLKNGFGKSIPSCTIRFSPLKNTLSVIKKLECSTTTSGSGHYDINLNPSEYAVYAQSKKGVDYHIGDIVVYIDSPDSSLNDFLTAQTEADITPEFIHKLNQIRDEIEKLSIEAKASSESALISATNAALSAESAAVASDDAGNSASVAKSSADAAAESEKLALKSATNAALSYESSAAASDDSRNSAIAAKSSADAAANSEISASKSAKQSELHANKIIELNPIFSINNKKADENGNINIDSGFNDAPKNGKSYIRKNGTWEELQLSKSTFIESESIDFYFDEKLIETCQEGMIIHLKSTGGSPPNLYFYNSIKYNSDYTEKTEYWAKYTPKWDNDIIILVESKNFASYPEYLPTLVVNNTIRLNIYRNQDNAIKYPLEIMYNYRKNDTSISTFTSHFVLPVISNVFIEISSINNTYNDKKDYLSIDTFVHSYLPKYYYDVLSRKYGQFIFSDDFPDCKLKMQQLILRYMPESGETSIIDTNLRCDYLPIELSRLGLFYRGHDYTYVHPFGSKYKVRILSGPLSDDKLSPQNIGITVKLVDEGDKTVNLKDIFTEIKNSNPVDNVEISIMYPVLSISGNGSASDDYLEFFYVTTLDAVKKPFQISK